MAIVALFTVSGMSAEKYDQVIKQLEAAGAGTPPGRLYHLCYGSPDNLQVCDVYESPAAMESFARTLLPILQQAGIEARPDVQPVHSMVAGT